jgi:hypothetical protein
LASSFYCSISVVREGGRGKEREEENKMKRGKEGFKSKRRGLSELGGGRWRRGKRKIE